MVWIVVVWSGVETPGVGPVWFGKHGWVMVRLCEVWQSLVRYGVVGNGLVRAERSVWIW